MKKLKLFVIFYILILTNSCFSQSGWFWQNPYPQGNDYESVKFFDQYTGYAVGWGNAIVKTTNSGNNWFNVNNGVKQLIDIGGYGSGILRRLHVFNGDTVIAAGSSVIKTTNGGITWFLLSRSFSDVSDLYFINSNTGFAVYSQKVYKSINGGVNWNSANYNPSLRSISFIDQITGYIGCSNGSILKTTDTGVSWFSFSSILNSSIYSIQFINSQTGFCGDSHEIFKTTNGGLNWDLKLSPGGISGGQFSFCNTNTGYFSHWGGKVYKTINGGDTWDSTVLTGLTASISSPQSNICVVVGSGGVIYGTTNGGINWNCISSQLGNLGTLNLIVCPTSEVAYITGNNGILLKTTDSGNLWFKLNSDINTSFTGLYFLNRDSGFTGNNLGDIFYTSNGGINWAFKSNINTNNPASNIFFMNLNTGFIVSHDKIFKTTNTGLNWSQYFYLAGSVIGNLQFVNYQTGYCTVSTGGCTHCPPPVVHIYKTSNQGVNWSQISFHDSKLNNGFVMINEIVGFISNSDFNGTNNGIKKTTNGGINWYPSLNYNAGGMFFIDENTGYTTAGYKTSNSGINWYYQFNDISPSQLKSLAFFNSNIGFMIGGYSGTIIKTTDGGGIGTLVNVNNIYDIIIKGYSLSQNYPNPFNPQTKIKFAVPKASFTKLIIYDLLGREIATLVNEELRPGTYEADWDGSSYSSGVYFYKIISEGFVETKKMVLMK